MFGKDDAIATNDDSNVSPDNDPMLDMEDDM